ncbi:divalent metal cation transporter [Altererythrobacter lutimaris]|uniref:Divalent metal cation transporter n=1 Tax=Altererythrobacter lutimaris TaxID=2743979 RepID=A0A850HDB1_9SPHN|nr:divalent metal cation transporter [Altererythrobacter lutimaris]NVE95365.1 divalent metal cation transporter [Altererythrobacter lutimaris]
MWRMIGPAMLFSGAAIGTSHLFQSTRAGAVYGLGLVAVILIACLLRYPAFRFGVDYGHSAKKSLVQGYRELGLWGPIIFAAATLAVVPTIFAALSSATAGITIAVFGLGISVPVLAIILLSLCSFLLLAGGYDWLDMINRLLVAFLLVSTLITTAMVFPQVQWNTLFDYSWAADPKAILFIVALAGFMPNALDVSIAQSMWTAEAEGRQGGTSPVELNEARGAFLAGYAMTAILAVCFCIMGAGVMHSSGIVPETSAPGLATQIIGLYSSTLGEGAAIIAAIAALSVMFTTLLVALDIGGRNVATTWQTLTGSTGDVVFKRVYRVTIPVLVAIAALVLFVFTDSFTAMLDLATSSAFVAAPVIATLNHLVVTRCVMPDGGRPSYAIRMLSLLGIAVMTILAITYFML